MAYPRYDHPALGKDQLSIMQGSDMKLSSYGIPPKEPYFVDKPDKERSFVKIPFDESIHGCKEFKEKLLEVDEHMKSKEMKEKLFGKKASKYNYVPIVRVQAVDDDDDDDDDKKKKEKKNTTPKYDYMKAKLDLTYPDFKIKTRLVKAVKNEDGKTEREPIDVETLDDVSKHLCFLSEFKPIFRIAKLWAHPPKGVQGNPPQYGLVFKLIKAEVKPSTKTPNIMKEFMDADGFIDSDDDDDEQETTQQDETQEEPTPTTKATKATKATKETKGKSSKVETKEESEDSSDDDSSDSDDDDEDESEEEEPPKKTKGKGKTKSK
jgi:hypothetical protein